MRYILNTPVQVLVIKVLWSVLVIIAPGYIDINAQSITDTIFHIPDVVISASRNQQFRNDIKTDVISSDELSSYAGESLGHFFMSSTALNVKSYGVGGGLSNISLRGSSVSQVQVNWNGFPINAVTLGSCDFSMIPATGFDRVSVVYGAPGALYGSGTFGGAINLDNNLKLEKVMSGSVNAGYESLKTFDGNVLLNIGNNKVAWKSNIWGAGSDNEFTYYDYIMQSERKQINGGWHDAGTIQQIIFRLSSTSTLEAGVWYQFKSYNIPSRIGSVSYGLQRDSTLKFYSAYKKSGNRWGLQVKAALFNDDERYTEKASAQAPVNSIDSRITSHQAYGDINFRYYLLHGLSADAGVTFSYITADVTAHGQTKVEKGLTAFAGAKYELNRLSCLAEIRREWNSNFRSGLLPSFGIAWKMIPARWTLRANVSQKFRKPTFNDLFWIPGGNPDLKPETGYSIDIGSVITVIDKENAKLSADIGVYWSQINNMIVWRSTGAYFMAMNYQSVRSAGMDGSLLFDLINGRFKYHSSLKVMLNRSDLRIPAAGEQEKMLYSPKVITSWENSLSEGIFDLTVYHHFTADRFYDNFSLLKPYQLLDIQTGIKVPVNKMIFAMHITVNNVTNTTYELIRLYPMPGRYWSVRISCSF